MKDFIAWVEKFFSRKFLIALTVILSTLIQTDLLPAGSTWIKIVGWAVAALTALGYGLVSNQEKKNALKNGK